MKSEFKKAGTLQLTRESVVSPENCCVWEPRELMAADGGYLLWMTSYLSSHSTSASVSELSRLVTVSSPKCNSEKRPLSNSVAFRTLFKWHRYCGILKIHIIRKINTGIRYEPVYRPALPIPTVSIEERLADCVLLYKKMHWNTQPVLRQGCLWLPSDSYNVLWNGVRGFRVITSSTPVTFSLKLPKRDSFMSFVLIGRKTLCSIKQKLIWRSQIFALPQWSKGYYMSGNHLLFWGKFRPICAFSIKGFYTKFKKN